MAGTAETNEFNYIVHPTDFSEERAHGFHHALRLAVAARAHFYLVHVASATADEIGNWSAFPVVRSTLADWGLLPEDASPAAVYQQLGVRVTKSELQHREPVEGLLHFLDANPADFLVLAPDLRADHAGRYRHSVSLPLARRAHLPSLFLPVGVRGFVDGLTGAATLRRILLASENGISLRRAGLIALRLARSLGCDDAVLHVLENGSGNTEVDAIGWPEERTVRVPAASTSSEAVAAQGAAIDADLIVLASRDQSGVVDQLRGNAIEQILRAAERPLLVVPSH
jgi:nucleotide-binding universal stress UspA family protein